MEGVNVVSLQNFLTNLHAKGIHLFVEQGKLKSKSEPGAITPELATLIQANKEALINFLEENHDVDSGAERIGKMPAGVPLRLSFAQQRLWLLDQIEGGSPHYNIPAALKLQGDLNIPALQRSFSTIISRHESLRTCFVQTDDEQVVQSIGDGLDFKVSIVDISAFQGEQQSAELKLRVEDEATRPFNLSRDLMLRVQLLRLSANEHALLVTIHHIVSDGWSMGILIREFKELYSAYTQDKENPLPPLEIQYSDYAFWQRNWLKGAVLERQLNYWTTQLAGLPNIHQLPLDYPRTNEQTFDGSMYVSTVGRDCQRRLKALCQQHDATFFMGIHAAFSVLLARYSGETDIVVGTPIANREHAEIAPLIGFFVNTLVLRSDLSANPTFTQLLMQSKHMLLQAYEHQQLPFEQIVEQLKPARSSVHSPLFQIMLVLQNNERGRLELPNLSLSRIAQEDRITAKFDLTLNVTETERGTVLGWEYNSNLFELKTIEFMAQHFELLLESMTVEPQQTVLHINMLTESERQQQLIGWNGVKKFNSDNCIHQMFEKQVHSNPHAIALIFEQENGNRKELSYGELNERANRLAHYLISEKQVVPDSLVGICVERSVEMIVAILAVQKAGGAYVPLDPAYPEARLKYILEDSGLKTVLTYHHLSQLEQFSTVDVVVLDDSDFLSSLHIYPSCDIAPEILGLSSRHLAYVIYTSGSTGLPKGVLIEHHNICRLFDATAFDFRFDKDDVWTMFHSFSFDFSVWEIWGALVFGGRLVIVPQDICRSTSEFYQLLENEKVTVLNQTPTAFAPLAAIGAEQSSRLSLRYVVFGGEALNLQSLATWVNHFGDDCPQLINMYGITETTVHASFKRITRKDIECKGTASMIGGPLADLQIFLLNSQQALVPVGVIGEIYVGGAGVARGYLNRPELTAERFIKNPFYSQNHAICSERLYRSGDLARRMEDGSLEYLGRIDNQVKIRGFRIELGEIQNVLLRHPLVNDVVVLDKLSDTGEKRLVAYVAADIGLVSLQDFTQFKRMQFEFIESLRQFLSQELPEYMVPQVFVHLDKLPLTTNGKVDIRALPEPEMSIPQEEYIAPVTPTEHLLCQIWQNVLRLERVGTADNFFKLGGDSILSIQVVSHAVRAGLHFSVKDLFMAQTIIKLAPKVKFGSKVLAMQENVFGAQRLLPIQQQFFSDETDLHHFNQSVLLSAPVSFDAKSLPAIVRKIYERHDALRLKYVRTETGWSAEYLPLTEEILDTVVMHQKWWQDDFSEIQTYVSDIQQGMRPELGQLFKVVYLQPQNSLVKGRLLLIIHHLVVDGVSWRILLEDIETLYSQWQAGSQLLLARKTSSYQQWADFLHQFTESDALHRERDFWLESFKAPVKPLFEFVPKKAVDTELKKIVGTVSFSLDEALTDLLLKQANNPYRTQINELLLAAVFLGIQQTTGTKTIRLDLEGHGREMLNDTLDLSQTVGWFTTVYPLTLSSLSDDSLSGLICSVKESYRAIPAKGIGFGLLKYIAKDPAFQNLPLSELVFNYLGQFDRVVHSQSLFGPAGESVSNNISQSRQPANPLTLNCMISQGRLSFTMTFKHALYDISTVQSLCDNIRSALQQIVDHCVTITHGKYTPSDFPLAQFTDIELQQWVGKADIADLYPSIGLQQGLLFHSMLQRGSFVVQNVLKFEQLDCVKFKQSWQQVVKRHNVFRTAFVGLDSGNPHQLVYTDVSLPWYEADLTTLEHSEQLKQLEQLRIEEQERGFEPEKAPLMRFCVLHMGNNIQNVIWSYHHALMDGWCLPLVIAEVTECYRALLAGDNPRLKSVSSYQDYVVWLARQDRHKATQYWRDKLQSFTERTPLPLVSARVDPQLENTEASHDEVSITFNQQQTEQLTQFAQNAQVTVNIVVQAAWALLLSRYCGTLNVVFGAVTSGRPAELPGVEDMVGLFINSLPVIVDIDEQQTVQQWLRQLHQLQLERESYNYIPLHEIQLLGGDGLGLFDSLLVFENYPVGEAIEEQMSGAAIHLRGVESYTGTNYAMTVVAYLDKYLSIQLQVKKQLLSELQVNQVAAHLQQIISVLAVSENLMVSQVAMLDAEQTNYQIRELNINTKEYPASKCMHHLFEQQVEMSANAVAAIFEDQQLSYQQLNIRANRLAHFLIESGVGRAARIGIYLERSLEMMIAVLAVMKAGAAYVPIEPKGPHQRTEFILEDADVEVVLLTSDLMDSLPVSGVDIVLMDDAAINTAWFEEYADENPDSDANELTSDSLVYILYTSGSTGRPKGVMVHHGGLVNYLTHAKQNYFTDDIQGGIVSSPLCFDATITTLLTPLCVGKPVILLPDNEQTLALLENYLFSGQSWLFKITPAHLMAIAYVQDDRMTGSSQHRIVVGGEQLTVQILKKWRQQLLPNTLFINEYGPTETVVGCSVFYINDFADLDAFPHAIAIGKPIINTCLFVMRQGRIVPFGAVGELHISGEGVTKGYLNHSQLTAEKFYDHQFENGEIHRLYKTGDLVRYLADGNLEYLGRIDDQVKLRGYRIELGEIESLLNHYPGVDESLVLLDGEGQQLLAYLVCADSQSREKLDIAVRGAVSEYLAEKLPQYMVPSMMFVLDSFPLTQNGKIDKKALPKHFVSVQSLTDATPKTSTEQWLVQLWQDMLKTSGLGRSSDFFKVGGHSLLAMRFISVMAKEYNIEITLKTLFENSVLANLAKYIDQQERRSYSAIQIADRNLPLPLSYPQRRLWFIDKFNHGSSQYNIPIAIRLCGKLNHGLFQSTLTQIIERHEVLRSCYHDGIQGPVQVVLQEHNFRVHNIDLTAFTTEPEEQERQVQVILRTESARPFDLKSDLMFRVTLLTLSKQDYVVQFVMHHIASDGWSLDLLVSEFVELYSAGYQQRASHLLPLPVQYADFSCWQVSDFTELKLSKQISYWQQQLTNLPLLHSLPLDKIRPAKQQFEGGCYDYVLQGDLLKQLNRVAAENDVTLFMLLYSAFVLLLKRWSNDSDIVIGSPVAGRTNPDLESLIGFFVNALVFRTQLDENLSFEQLLAQTKVMMLAAFEHQDLPFEMLVDELEVVRSLSHSPLFQIIMTMQNRGDGVIELPELALSRVQGIEIQSKFDLELVITEQAEKLYFKWIYARSLFEHSTVVSLADGLKLLLTQIVENSQAVISQYTLLDKQLWIEQINNTSVSHTEHTRLDRWFEYQVESGPELIALECGPASFSYRQLNAKANQLSHALIEKGVKPGDVVGLYAGRCTELVVAVLAVIKTGAAYLPIDPTLPNSRIEYMVADSEAVLVLVENRLVTSHQFKNCNSMLLGTPESYSQYPVHNLSISQIDMDSLCYIIYTSGSTGMPKGVMVHNGGVINYLHYAQQHYITEQISGAVLSSPLSFDATVTTLLTPLISGRKLVILPEAQDATISGLIRYLNGAECYLFKLTPAHLELLNSHKIHGNAEHIIVVGGEQLKVNTLLPWKMNLLPNSIYVNEYGPTETVVGCTTYWVRKVEDIDPDMLAIPIGRPISNTQVYILRDGQPVATGAVGELHIGGAGVTPGYLMREILTAEKFIQSPFDITGNATLYRSGDLVRYRHNGYLEFVGRIDDQVKIRGYRIEVAEVEKQLVKHADVKEAVVVVEGHGNEQHLIAYFTSENTTLAGAAIRQWLKAVLPEYMIPELYIAVPQFGLTANGKIDRKSLPKSVPVEKPQQLAVGFQGNIEQQLKDIWSKALGVDKISVHDNFFEIGGNSLLSVRLQTLVEEHTVYRIELTDIFEYPTIASLSRYLAGQHSDDDSIIPEILPASGNSQDIAVIGMSGRFPGAADLEEFWLNISSGVESLHHYSDQQLLDAGVDPIRLQNPNYVKSGYVLEGLQEFDAGYFGFSPREAELLDPQQRFLLECASEALEHGGYGDSASCRNVGVFVGVAESKYLMRNILPNAEVLASTGKSTFFGNSSGFSSTLVSYKLNLTGPSINVLTACSTSLVAVHQACNSLLLNECDMALAGGSSITLLKPGGYIYEEGGIVSPDGHCRPFDKDAKGTRAGSGAGVLLLKRLDKALADRDTIHAVIKGSAINNDASDKVSYAAPSVAGQTEVIKRALGKAGVSIGSIEYVEAHGTGTAIGDPIEVKALKKAYGNEVKGYCALGTLKANIGHLDTAAGVAGLIKVILAIKHRQIPPSINFNQSNSQIDFADTPFYVNRDLKPWYNAGNVRRAAVSSFGVGGTNAHVIVEEAPTPAPESDVVGTNSCIFPLSAMSESTLLQSCENLRNYFQRNKDVRLHDVAYTLQVGRTKHEYRTALVCGSREEAISLLADIPKVISDRGEQRSVVFMFPGQGSQYLGMAQQLYLNAPLFRTIFDDCAAKLQLSLNIDLHKVVYPDPANDSGLGKEQLDRTEFTQPALFVVEYCTAKLLQSWGLEPDAMIGHSIGEYVAACLAGVLSLEDALMLVSTRGRLMAKVAAGAMLSIAMPVEQLQPLLVLTGSSLAGINAPGYCVAAGDNSSTAQLILLLDQKQVEWRKLHTSHAFHSSMMDCILDEFKAVIEQVSLNQPTKAYVSNVTGQFITPAQAQDPQYWLDHLRGTVQFSAGIETLLSDHRLLHESKVLIEVGPGNGLITLARKHEGSRKHILLSAMRHLHETACDMQYLQNTLAKLWCSGLAIDWQSYNQIHHCTRIPLPTYPFEKSRYWIEPVKNSSNALVTHAGKAPSDKWWYVPVWRQKPHSRRVAKVQQLQQHNVYCWLLLMDQYGVGEDLAQQLELAGQQVVKAWPGDGFSQLGHGEFSVNLKQQADYAKLLDYVFTPIQSGRIIHLSSISDTEQGNIHDLDAFRQVQDKGVFSCLYTVKTLASLGLSAGVRLDIVSNDMYRIIGEEVVDPAKATLVAIAKIAPQEYQELEIRHIDVSLKCSDSETNKYNRSRKLFETLMSSQRDSITAIRGNQNWQQIYENETFVAEQPPAFSLRDDGVYLITGGLGNIGLLLAGYISKTVKNARLILVSRSSIPAEHEWDQLLEQSEHQVMAQKIRQIRALRASCAEVLVLNADVAELPQMKAILDASLARFGHINGVIHCAGQVHGSMVALMDTEQSDFDRQYRAKVQGLMVLDQLLSGYMLDFCLLMSSLSSVLGGLGFSAYAAANAYMDSFVQNKHAQGDDRWLSVNWDGWNFNGNNDNFQAMTPEEGEKAFALVLANAFSSQIVHSTYPLEQRLNLWINKAVKVSHTLYARPNVSTHYVMPSTSIEEKLVAVWQEILGIEQIGVDDHFFDLGGDSLVATRVISAIRQKFAVTEAVFSIRDFFDKPVIKHIAAKIMASTTDSRVQEAKSMLTEEGKVVEEGVF